MTPVVTIPFSEQRRRTRHWLGLAVVSLVLAGVLSLLLVVGRLPGLHGLFSDPLFFKRALVVHVDLALVVWFGAFFCAMYQLVPLQGGQRRRPHVAVGLSAAGVALLVAAAGVGGAEPVLANYVPVVDHPAFVGGLGLFAAGVGVALVDGRLLAGREGSTGLLRLPGSARAGLRAGAVVALLALLTFGAATVSTPRALPAATYYELVAWGGGHVLQFVSVFGMLVAWLVLLERALGFDPVPRRVAAVLFALLAVPVLAGPALALRGTDGVLYHAGFTEMMRWGSWPPVVAFIALCARSVLRARAAGRLPANPLRHPWVAATAASMALTAAGFVLGAMIRGPNTMVPAHYHASIGAVTVAYMALTWPLLGELGLRLPRSRLSGLVPWQPIAFGAGQLVFAVGFGLAGAHGMARKAYAGEQQIRSMAESIGLGIMGLGGLLAIVAGVVFLWLVARAWLTSASLRPVSEEGVVKWKSESIRSRS
ncbi:MAG: hypothetical protein ACOC97_00435 [Myxococcota bacterium]